MGAKSITTVLLLALAIFSLDPPGTAQINDMAVVVNPGNPATNISFADLRKMFAGAKRSWPGGLPLKLITRGPGCIERLILLKLLAMSESEYKQYWTAQVFRGEADAEPLTVPSLGMQREALSIFPGGITLVNVREVKPGMKVLKVDGHFPGEPAYPVH
jgi:hypothetical protein